MNDKPYKKQYCYSLFKRFDKLLIELDLINTLNHNSEKGREAEEVLRCFFQEYLPQKFSVTTGFINSHLGISSQCDILIYDALHIAPIFSGYVNKVINIIATRAVVESTMYLDKKKLQLDNNKFSSVKNFYRSDEYIQQYLKKEPLTVLFAYRCSIKRDAAFKTMLNRLENKYIDVVFCADKGTYILNKEKNIYVNCNPNNFYGITIDGYNASKEKHGFAIFYSYLMNQLESIECQYKDYDRMLEYMRSSIYIDYKKNQDGTLIQADEN